ncbi:hybrid sensor histidine kinase/response regulator [Acutalibacter caecimuris]|uniref:hybrid sensor histidine kinase/response regulator n=1 Tax=Acutalibacter caecimuris TaxID=3093657 RepID=UPI002AC8BA6E|nr:ATP-binding protein [Acutalibacter sp. M00118]
MDKPALDLAWGGAGIPIAAFAPGGRTDLYQNALAQALTGGSLLAALPADEAQALCRALDGHPQPPLFLHLGGQVFSTAVFPQGGLAVCLLNPVTEYYMRNQAALDEALMASRAKTNFLSEMSHDIRTPMGAIVGLTEIALGQPGAPAKVHECLEKIKVASGHMMSLLNEVLDMSRIESGRVQIQPERASVADLLHEILVVAMPQADAGGLAFSLEMGQVAQEELLLDPVRLKQVCLNLLSNAIKYTPRGGQVWFHFAVLPAAGPDSVSMELVVRDNGIGMSREFLTKLFSPFEREERSVVNKIQGTGLGMAITKSLIELMGGVVCVESEPDKGSCFTVRIPFPTAPGAAVAFPALSGKRVLLLESDPHQAELALSMLRSLGMQADLAADANEAVFHVNSAALDGGGYYALLTAEKLDGCEITLLLPELRQLLGPELPILLLAASDWSQVEYMFTRSGVDGYIPLPLFKSRLAAGLLRPAQEETAGQPGPAAILSLDGRRLLLAEDNELNREIAQELIGGAGARIDCAENGRQAVDLFAASAPGLYDAILMDIQMPIMNGLDATRAIRALPRPDAAQVPIIAMTANAFVEDIKNSLDAGMDAHISKPLDMDKVFSTIRGLLDGRQP